MKVSHLNPPNINGKYRRIVNLHCAIPSLFKLFSENHNALGVLDFFFGDKAELYTSLYYEIGSAQEPHRDTPYFWTNPGYKYFGVWVALEDANINNGCLQVIPKSHLIPEEDRDLIGKIYYPDQDLIPPADHRLWVEYQKRANQRASEYGLQLFDVEVQKGDTIIWHPHTLHGGRPIFDSNRTRNSFVMHVTPPNTSVYHHQGFFNSYKSLIPQANYEVTNINNRNYRNYDQISFEHILEVDINRL